MDTVLYVLDNFTYVQFTTSMTYAYDDVQCVFNDTHSTLASADVTACTFECEIPSQLINSSSLSVGIGVPALNYVAATFVLQRVPVRSFYCPIFNFLLVRTKLARTYCYNTNTSACEHFIFKSSIFSLTCLITVASYLYLIAETLKRTTHHVQTPNSLCFAPHNALLYLEAWFLARILWSTSCSHNNEENCAKPTKHTFYLIVWRTHRYKWLRNRGYGQSYAVPHRVKLLEFGLTFFSHYGSLTEKCTCEHRRPEITLALFFVKTGNFLASNRAIVQDKHG